MSKKYSFLSSCLYRFTHSKWYLKIERWLRAYRNKKNYRFHNPDAQIDSELMSWWSPVRDEFRGLTEEEIKRNFQANALPGAIVMSHLTGDFNIATLIRTANAFGIKDLYYFGKRKIDRRGAKGSYHYMNIVHLSSLAELKKLKEKYYFVAVEQNSRSVPLSNFQWPENSLLLFGEEKCGLSKEVLDLADMVVEIPMMGTIRSLNVGVSGGIAIHSYASFNSFHSNE